MVVKTLGWVVWVDSFDSIVRYSSKDVAWADVPDDGIVYKMLYKDVDDGTDRQLNPPNSREAMIGVDNYFEAPHRDGTIYGSGNESIESIQARYPGAVVKKGKWVPSETFSDVQKLATDYVW